MEFNVSSVSSCVSLKATKMGRFLQITVKRGSRVGAWTSTLKNHTKCLWRWEPNCRFNFFFNPPAHLCAVTYMTEIALIVTLNNQFNSTQPIEFKKVSRTLEVHVCIKAIYIIQLSKVRVALPRWGWVELNLLFNVTVNDISVIYVTAHRCAGGLKKKLDLRSGSQRHRHFVGFFNVPVLAPTRDHPFYTVIPTHRPI